MKLRFHRPSGVTQFVIRPFSLRGRVDLGLGAWCVVALAGAVALTMCSGDSMAQSSKALSATASTPSGDAQNGRKLFVRDGCYECHGREAQGGGLNGPRVAPNPIPYSALLAFVRNPTGEMPPFSAKVLSEKDLADIYAFLSSIPEPPPLDSVPILKH